MNDDSLSGGAPKGERRGFSISALVVAFAIALTVIWSGGFANFPSALAQTDTPTEESTSSVADVAEQATKAVVTITNLREFDEDSALDPRFPDPVLPRDPDGANEPDSGSDRVELIPVSEGSGYIIDEEGHIVTNNHVVAGGSEFEVEFYDGTTATATLVGADALQDVAVLELDDQSQVPGTLTFANSDDVEIGDDVIAIGNPFGDYPNSVSQGDVTGLDRSLDTGAGYEMPNLIQHDASIYPGNSGGPLLNTDGEVIGMNVAKAVDAMMGTQVDGIGLAIESNAVKEIVDQVIQFGEVQRPYLGIRSMLTDEGVLVDSVEPDSPAAEAGLRPNDLITEVDGEAIDQDNPLINEVIFEHVPGDQVTLTVERDGEEQEIQVTLGTRPSDFQ